MSSQLPPDPYKILGVSKDASLATVRTAYRKLVLQCHPDKVQNEALRSQKIDEFQRVQQAYETLSDDQKRQQYDQQVKLAELRKETTQRRGPIIEVRTAAPRASYSYRDSPRTVYEDKKPSRPHEDDIKFSSTQIFEDTRASSRKYDGYSASTRKPQTRMPEERRSTRATEDARGRERERDIERQLKELMREKEKTTYSERKKMRDKERKRDFADKYSKSPYVESDSGSDSDHSYTYRNDRRAEEEGRRERARFAEEAPRSRREREYDDEHARKIYAQESEAFDYIAQSRGARDGRPADPYRGKTSNSYYEMRREPSPPKADARRSSVRPRERVRERAVSPVRASPRDRRGTAEIVDPPSGYTTRKPPTLQTSQSSPASIKIPVNTRPAPAPQRASTMQYQRDSNFEIPAFQRSNTTPITNIGSTSRRKESTPMSGSRLREQDSGYSSHSGYSSPVTPGTSYGREASPNPRYTKYTIVEEPDEYRGGGSHRTVKVVDPDNYRRARSISPPPVRRATVETERPPLATHSSSSARHSTPTRTSSYAYPAEPMSAGSRPPPPPLSRSTSTSTRPSPMTSVPRTAPPLSRGEAARSGRMFGDYDVRYSPKLGPESVSYSYGSNRRGGGPEALARDGAAYLRTSHADMPRHPGMARSETFSY
ncbi:DnaJ-domain-containing protein [Xylona heveae TC161]|uniref:DnaJ-domain-containing protein n=1 Tax=Xylona heveae (strain CBS 132557 / TC161) TaxID=1328760 RepID=A0A165GG51_XYLHT|nr:DnaJ-domain-containing protein [Xylona heveae TC161]KZF22140.1 DnaJ-domain-containing protein [Xylona heveae TC161]